MGEKRRHFQSKAESHRREGLRKLQTSLLGSEIREIAKRKIWQVPTNGTVYRDILKEISTTARRDKEGPADLVTLRRQMIKVDLHRRVYIPEPQSKTVAMACEGLTIEDEIHNASRKNWRKAFLKTVFWKSQNWNQNTIQISSSKKKRPVQKHQNVSKHAVKHTLIHKHAHIRRHCNKISESGKCGMYRKRCNYRYNGRCTTHGNKEGRRWWWPSSSSKPASNETGFEAYRERQHLFLQARLAPKFLYHGISREVRRRGNNPRRWLARTLFLSFAALRQTLCTKRDSLRKSERRRFRPWRGWQGRR